MHEDITAISQALDAQRGLLAEQTVAFQYRAQPDLVARYGPLGRTHCLKDTASHLQYLVQALAVATPELFVDYLLWAKALLEGRHIPATDLIANLGHLRDAVQQLLGVETATTVLHYLDLGIAACSAPTPEPSADIPAANPHGKLAQHYLDALLATDREHAHHLIEHAIREGVSIKEIYVHVFQHSQQEIGRRWARAQLSVAQEHYCTAATQLIISQLYPSILSIQKNGRTLVATCVAGDLHELGVRMVADFFEMEGWTTIYLGANTPATSIVQMVIDHRADVLALSATMSYHLQAVADVIAGVRGSVAQRVIILVGGYPFSHAPELWKKLGADGYAADAEGSLRAVTDLLAARGRPGIA